MKMWRCGKKPQNKNKAKHPINHTNKSKPFIHVFENYGRDKRMFCTAVGRLDGGQKCGW